MKTQSAILLLIIHLMVYTDLVQLLKFPNLIQHFQLQHSKNKSLGIIEFLQMHYGNKDYGDPKDDKEDMQLPFKTMDFHIVCQVLIIPQSIQISPQPEKIFSDSFVSHYIG